MVLGALALLLLVGVVLIFRRVAIDMAADRLRASGQAPSTGVNKAEAAANGCIAAFFLSLGPTLLFVLTYELAPVAAGERLYVASAALAAAALAATLYRLAKPVPDKPRGSWRNLILFALAGATVALHDAFFVMVRPTLTNIVAIVLAAAALSGLSPRLEGWFRRDGMSLGDAGWRRLVAGSLLLFIALGTANEYVRRFRSEAFWVHFQLWGPPLFFILFMVAGYFLIRRHMPAGQCPAKPRTEQPVSDHDQSV